MNEHETPLDDLTIIGGSVVLKRTKLDMMDANVLAGIQIGRKHFQDLIDRGELMVVKTATLVHIGGQECRCSNCDRQYTGWDMPTLGQFCTCGAKMVKP